MGVADSMSSLCLVKHAMTLKSICTMKPAIAVILTVHKTDSVFYCTNLNLAGII